MGDVLSRLDESSESGVNSSCSTNQARYQTLGQVKRELQRVGLEACELLIGVDFTKSNRLGQAPTAEGNYLNGAASATDPYTKALRFIAKRLDVYDDDHSVPCYGFGHVQQGKQAVFPFFRENEAAKGLDSVVERYQQIAPLVDMRGPTSFAPLIRQAMRDVYNSGMKFHVLLIISDGQISEECLDDTKQAIVDACAFPLSIVMIGVGEGPWDDMEHFDEELPGRNWDNFHFFQLNQVSNGSPFSTQERLEDSFEFNVIAELPEQYVYARTLTAAANRSRVSHLVDRTSSYVLLNPPTRRS